jgi:hypothetical protein
MRSSPEPGDDHSGSVRARRVTATSMSRPTRATSRSPAVDLLRAWRGGRSEFVLAGAFPSAAVGA